MNTSKLFLWGTLLVAICMALPAIAATPPLNGDAEADFTGPGILIIEDPGLPGDPNGKDVGVVGQPGGGFTPGSGWDIKDLRLTYDEGSDTMYVGINCWNIVGDADGDGDPNHATWGGGIDRPFLSNTETVAVYFDLDMNPDPFDNDFNWDVIAGVGSGDSIAQFRVAQWDTNDTFNPPGNFSPTALLAHTGIHSPNPDTSHPDFEFTILNWSQIPSTLDSLLPLGFDDPNLCSFRVGVFMGSQDDGSIGEDFVYYHQMPSTIVTITPSATVLIEGGTVNLTVTEENDSPNAFRGQLDGPGGPLLPVHSAFFPVQVAVTKNGSLLATLGFPPSGGDNGNSILDQGEIWFWDSTTVPTVPALGNIAITDSTEFIATGSGYGPADCNLTYPEDPNERAVVDVNILSTIVDVNSSDTLVLFGGTVDLTVTEENDGDEDLTNVSVAVSYDNGGGPTPLVTLIAPPDSGDVVDPGVLNVGEIWEWNANSNTELDDIVITALTTFTAKGSADYDVITVTYPDDLDEQDTVEVDVNMPPPVIDVEKTVDCEETLPGFPVFYEICIKNVGLVPVIPTSVFDDKLGDLTADFAAACTIPLPPDANCCLTFGPFIQEAIDDPNVNTVTFDANDLLGNAAPTATDTATVVLVEPSFTVSKTCLTDPVVEGEPARFRILITNTGDVDLSVITDEPTLLGPLPLPSGGPPIDVEIERTVEPGATEVCNVINVIAAIDTPDNPCIDGDVLPPQDANDCCAIPGLEGCTPGFWKNNAVNWNHSAWCDAYEPGDDFNTVFGIPEQILRANGKKTYNNPTLLQALDANGGGINALARHAVAALLNACSDCVSYPTDDPQDIIDAVQDAVAAGPEAIQDLHELLASYNEAGCPVNQHGDCVGIEDEI